MFERTEPGARRLVTLAIGAVALASPLHQMLWAQAVAGDSSRVTSARDSSRGGDPLFKKRDAFMALGFAVGTVAFFPVDRRVATELQDSSTQANRFFKNSSTGVELIASPGAYVIGGALYLVGRLGHHE